MLLRSEVFKQLTADGAAKRISIHRAVLYDARFMSVCRERPDRRLRAELARTWSILSMLRSYFGYAACKFAALVEQDVQRSGQLRVNWLAGRTGFGKVGITLLPGRRDFGRDLERDLAALQEERVGHAVCLVPIDELASYGVNNLLQRYTARGLRVRHSRIMDQGISSLEEMRATVRFIHDGVVAHENVVVQCVGGLGRSGMTAACWLVAEGFSATAAIEEVRRVRSQRGGDGRTG